MVVLTSWGKILHQPNGDWWSCCISSISELLYLIWGLNVESSTYSVHTGLPTVTMAVTWMFFACFSGSDDLSAKLWDVRTGQCVYGIQTHTCATVKFDEQKLVTGSFDNTIACWEWSTGAKIQQFRGHTGAGWCWVTHSYSGLFWQCFTQQGHFSDLIKPKVLEKVWGKKQKKARWQQTWNQAVEISPASCSLYFACTFL